MITIFTTKVNKIWKNITIDKFFIYTKTNIKISAITIFYCKTKNPTACQQNILSVLFLVETRPRSGNVKPLGFSNPCLMLVHSST